MKQETLEKLKITGDIISVDKIKQVQGNIVFGEINEVFYFGDSYWVYVDHEGNFAKYAEHIDLIRAKVAYTYLVRRRRKDEWIAEHKVERWERWFPFDQRTWEYAKSLVDSAYIDDYDTFILRKLEVEDRLKLHQAKHD